MKLILKSPPIPTQALTYSPKTKTFAGEASELRNYGVGQPRLEVRSQRTGLVEEFVYVRTDKDREGDVRFWEYKNATYGIKLVIYND